MSYYLHIKLCILHCRHVLTLNKFWILRKVSPASIVLNQYIYTMPLLEKWSRFDRWTTEFDFGFGIRTTVLNFGLGSRTTAFIFGLGSPITVLNFGFGSRTTALDFRLGSRTTVFNSGFGSQTTVLNFGFGSRTIAVTSRRSDSSNVSLVVLDKSLIILSKPLFWKIRKSMTDRPTDRQDLRIKSPRRRLKMTYTNERQLTQK